MSDDRGERPKLSWREIDQRRSGGGRRDEAPRGHAAKQAQRQQTRSALEEADSLFSMEKGGQEGAALAKAMRDAHGSPAFDDACRAYRDAVGLPDDPALLSLLLDCADVEIVIAALEALLALKDAGALSVSGGLKSQLRVLAVHRDDSVAGISEDLLEGA